MGSGYWQVVSEEEVCERLVFYTPKGKRQWKVIPAGHLNSDPTFLSMAMKLQTEWDTIAKENSLKMFASKIIVDDVLQYGRTDGHLLAYFRTVLYVLKHNRATLKLKK